MKKETIEEAAGKYAGKYALSTRHISHIGFEDGAKWQAERMYSEKEVLKLLNKFSHRDGMDKEENLTLIWFEQFKKK